MKVVYIDVQNTHQRTVEQWWLIDWGRLFVYLKQRYGVDTIYYVTGYVLSYQKYYNDIEHIWYTMLYKETLVLPDWKIKWNVDIDIAIQAMFDLTSWKLTKAYVMTNDGDYNTLVKVLIEHNVFGWLIAPDSATVSKLLTRLEIAKK